jgi:hypothetical protein
MIWLTVNPTKHRAGSLGPLPNKISTQTGTVYLHIRYAGQIYRYIQGIFAKNIHNQRVLMWRNST